MSMPKAVILAGGRGERLKPLTDDVPKPMINVKGKPFLEHQLELLKKNEILEVLLCVGYLNEKITDYFGDGREFGLKIEYSKEKTFLGTGGALKIAGELLSESFILLYGDSYLPIDYRGFVRFWSGCGDAAGALVCYDNKEGIAKNNTYLDGAGFVKKYNKKNPERDMNYVEAGVSMLKKSVLDILPSGRPASLEEGVFPALIKGGRLKGYPTGQRYYDIGTPGGLREIEGVLK